MGLARDKQSCRVGNHTVDLLVMLENILSKAKPSLLIGLQVSADYFKAGFNYPGESAYV